MATTDKDETAKKIDVVIAAIIGELGKLGHVAMRGSLSRGYDDPCVEFDDGTQVRVRVETRGAKCRLIVGDWDDDGRKNSPEPKGGFRIDEAAVLVWQIAEAKRTKAAREKREGEAQDEARTINDALGIDGGGPCYAAGIHAGDLALEALAPGTAEQITAMLRLAIELGLVKSSKPAMARRAPTHDESPALWTKIGKALGVEAKRVVLGWDGPFLRRIEVAEEEQMGVRGLSAPQIVALRTVGLVPGATGWELLDVRQERPAPVPNDGPEIWPLLIAEVTAGHYGGDTPAKRHLLADMRERDAVGRERYGVPLQPHNGRPALEDALDEALDLCAYLRQAQEEGRLPGEDGLVPQAVMLALGVRKRLDRLAERAAEKGEL